MVKNQSQEFLFQRIKELLPPHISLVDRVAEVLNISTDSAYRRIRGETPLVLEEVGELCRTYQISLDQLLEIRNGSTLFHNTRINLEQYSFELYLQELIGRVETIGSFIHKEIIYLTKDIPLFHNFYFKPLIAFRYFFWMKMVLQDKQFANRGFEMDMLPPHIEKLSLDLAAAYCKVPSSEIWNTESVNAAIIQIEFFKDSGYFSSSADIRVVYESLEETILHLKAQVETGCKFMPGESPASKKNNFDFFYNRVVLGDNTIMVVTDRVKACYLNYDILNYMVTRDERFCNDGYNYLKNLMKRSTLISQTGERQRNIFFGILLNKIADRKKNL